MELFLVGELPLGPIQPSSPFKAGSHYTANLRQPAIDSCELEKFPILCSNLQQASPLWHLQQPVTSVNKPLLMSSMTISQWLGRSRQNSDLPQRNARWGQMMRPKRDVGLVRLPPKFNASISFCSAKRWLVVVILTLLLGRCDWLPWLKDQHKALSPSSLPLSLSLSIYFLLQGIACLRGERGVGVRASVGIPLKCVC